MDMKHKSASPEVWGGIECTINRVEDRAYDQLELGDFYNKPGYLDDMIKLGFKKFRFPILWERHQPLQGEPIDWSWTAAQLDKLRFNGITPIAGLLHHGSGPFYTDLLQPDFPERFAAYALLVARRFPWIEWYTPINEPLTTARFSGLYELWYPHKQNDVSFTRILLNELKATVLAMQAIRKINPKAKLLQTEDLGKTYSTPLLAYQADFENTRRWLSFDILCGHFNEEHPLWNYLKRLGIEKDSLDFFLQHPCPPDIIGANYYVTSERYLDEDMTKYPLETRGGNTLHEYADVEAVRVAVHEPNGPEVLLQELYLRYTIPVAITEVQLNCSREEQLRWLKRMYEAAQKLSREMELVAITVWALTGSFGWDSLLTRLPGNYETGAFDTSAGYARPTGMVTLIKDLINGTTGQSLFKSCDGWWEQHARFYSEKRTPALSRNISSASRPLLIIGKNDALGKALATACAVRNIHAVQLAKKDINICNSESIEYCIRQYRPWAIINVAGYTNIEQAETESEDCYKINTLGSHKLGIACEFHNIKLVSFSSDMVFDGNKQTPYVESDNPCPLNVFGKSKLLAENFLTNVNPGGLIIRCSELFNATTDGNGYMNTIMARLQQGLPVTVPLRTVSPTYVPHLARAVLDLLIDDASGLWHLANKANLSWMEMAVQMATYFGMSASLVQCRPDESPVKRPLYSVLASERYGLMPALDDALSVYFTKFKISI